MNTHCREIEPNLSAYLFDELEKSERGRVEAHLGECAECRRELEELRGTLGAMDSRFKAEPVAVALAEGRVATLRKTLGVAARNGENGDHTESESDGAVSHSPKSARIIRIQNLVTWGVGLIAATLMLMPIYTNWEKRNDKLARVKADQKSLAGAIESYYVDNNAYPVADTKLASAAAGRDGRLEKLKEIAGADKASAPVAEKKIASVATPGNEVQTQTNAAILLSSTYDPTNGTTSNGDVYRTHDAAQEDYYRYLKTESVKSPKSDLKSLAYFGNRPAKPASAAPATSGGKSPTKQQPRDHIAGDLEEGAANNVLGVPDAVDFDKIPTDGMSADSGILWTYDKGNVSTVNGVAPISPGNPNAPRPNELRDQNAQSPGFGTLGPQTSPQPPPPDASTFLGEPSPRLLFTTGNKEYEKYYDLFFKSKEAGHETNTKQGLVVADAPESLMRQIPPQESIAPNGPIPDTMNFKDFGVNPFVETAKDKLSTFAVDVDKASYVMARNYLNRGLLPPAAAVRVEEIINYFPTDYKAPAEETFAVYSAMAPSPFGKGFQLLKIGIKGRETRQEARKPLVLTFVIDVSGSMAREDRLGLVKRALQMLVGRLKPDDQIGIAVYGSSGHEVLAHTPVSQSAAILSGIANLQPEGSTNLNEGLNIGYVMARRAFRAEAVNRVILCTDGVANNGLVEPDAILGQIAGYAKDNIYLTALGVGMGNYNDVLLERLADKGNGTYAYLDDDKESQRYIDKDLIGSMEVIAQDVKIQVEFNPGAVRQYRLLGFENRDVADKDFRNDAVDAGEIGAGHSVTALYELELNPTSEEDAAATVFIRYKQPDQEMAVKEIKGAIRAKDAAKSFDAADAHFKLAACAAEYAEILRNSYWARGSRMRDVAALFDASFPGNPPSPEAAELRGLMDVADRLTDNRPAPVPPYRRPGPPPDNSDGPRKVEMEENK